MLLLLRLTAKLRGLRANWEIVRRGVAGEAPQGRVPVASVLRARGWRSTFSLLMSLEGMWLAPGVRKPLVLALPRFLRLPLPGLRWGPLPFATTLGLECLQPPLS